MGRIYFAGAVAAAAMMFSVASHAAPVLGSNVDSSLFAAAIGSTAGWSYSGQSTAAFSGPGTAELRYRASNYRNSFGFSQTDHTNRVTVFGSGAPVGATSPVAGYDPSYLFYFSANGSDFFIFSDDNTQYTDGYASGGSPGQWQGDIDIFFNAALTQWAFFFDDAGGGLPIAGDDNDYNDMVVTFTQSGVPEPAAALLLGAALLGFGAVGRRRTPGATSAA